MGTSPVSSTAKRAKRQRQRNQYDRPRPKSLAQQPTERVRLRAFAGLLLNVEPATVSDELLQEVEQLLPEILLQLDGRRTREDAGRPRADYVVRYFGLGRPVMTTEAITEEFQVARTTVINAWRDSVVWMRSWLETQAPELVQRARTESQVVQNDFTFWDRVDRNGPGGCWLWQGAMDLGYGVVKRQQRKQQAHRYAYQLAVGDIPEGLFVVHICRRRNCVNPEHLRLAEPGEEVTE